MLGVCIKICNLTTLICFLFKFHTHFTLFDQDSLLHMCSTYCDPSPEFQAPSQACFSSVWGTHESWGFRKLLLHQQNQINQKIWMLCSTTWWVAKLFSLPIPQKIALRTSVSMAFSGTNPPMWDKPPFSVHHIAVASTKKITFSLILLA